jgi:hypothetical protein
MIITIRMAPSDFERVERALHEAGIVLALVGARPGAFAFALTEIPEYLKLEQSK